MTTGQYTVTLVQLPHSDFYMTGFDVRRNADGRVANVLVDPDADKWWRLRVVTRGTRSYFVYGFGGITPETPYYDAADGTLFAGPYGGWGTRKLEEFEYQ